MKKNCIFTFSIRGKTRPACSRKRLFSGAGGKKRRKKPTGQENSKRKEKSTRRFFSKEGKRPGRQNKKRESLGSPYQDLPKQKEKRCENETLTEEPPKT